ncbi:AraC family transcriptional regulator [Bacillus marinisedimentorum]|uniref:AraC family transcriptional regulator n=1 Tax=Bacillus marinisedimentorum TaxID=1821260 RepID=UPI0007E053A2|nr:AraC family transcriptional regulator [Bacillus marinisedimentorum]
MENAKIRYTFSSFEKTLPLFIESIGYNPQEEDFARPEGYPYFHWLQTVRGEGTFSYMGEKHILGPKQGILLTPFTPHSYTSNNSEWSTLYITFAGSAAESILDSLGINHNALYYESADLPFSTIILDMLRVMEQDPEYSNLELSEYLYSFIILLKKYQKQKSQKTSSNDKIRSIAKWLEEVYHENIGLKEIAEKANMSSQNLSALFRRTFGTSPYSFLIHLRLREAKKRLVEYPELPLREIAQSTGFNDLSHFVATFRKVEGITPKKYRNLFNEKS